LAFKGLGKMDAPMKIIVKGSEEEEGGAEHRLV